MKINVSTFKSHHSIREELSRAICSWPCSLLDILKERFKPLFLCCAVAHTVSPCYCFVKVCKRKLFSNCYYLSTLEVYVFFLHLTD